jgi:hypothetical protein
MYRCCPQCECFANNGTSRTCLMRQPLPAAYHLNVEAGVNADPRPGVGIARATAGGLMIAGLATGAATA